MTCPYLKEVSMVFCRAYPVKKLVPLDRVTTANTCESDGFQGCPLYREAHAKTERSVDAETQRAETQPTTTESKGARP